MSSPTLLLDTVRNWQLAQPSDIVDLMAQPVDPYLLWHLSTHRWSVADFRDEAAVPDVPVLVELEREVAHLGGELRPGQPGAAVELHLPKAAPLWPMLLTARHQDAPRTAVHAALTTLPGLVLLALSDRVDGVFATVANEARRARVLRFELGVARRREPTELRGMGVLIDFSQPDGYRKWLGLDMATRNENVPTAAPAPAGPVVCVIDDRLSYASPHHRAVAAGAIWHQGGNPQTLKALDGGRRWGHAQAEAWNAALQIQMRFGAGIVPVGFDLTGSMQGRIRLGDEATAAQLRDSTDSTDSTDSAESAVYRSEGYVDPLFRWSHGSAVLDLILNTRAGTAARGRSAAAAPQQVRCVQLPIPAVLDTSGGSLAAHALAAVRWAVEQEAPGSVVIANLSFGTHSGGHDGTSLWDKGLCELLDTFDGKRREANGRTLHVVLPAGNSHLLRCHASKLLTRAQPALQLRWKVQPDNVEDSALEIWLPPGAQVTVEVKPPDGSEKVLRAPGRHFWQREARGESQRAVHAALLWPQRAAQSLIGTMVLLVVGPTAHRADRPAFQRALSAGVLNQGLLGGGVGTATHGVWQVTVSLKDSGASSAHVHAWVQRGDVAPGRGQQTRGYRGRQSTLLDVGDDPQGTPIDPRFTLNGIATLKHERLHVVGAMRGSDCGLSAYSGAGPNRLCEARFEGPDRVVVADESLNQPGLLVSGMLSGARLRLSGTSMAAAAYTRLLYEHLRHSDSGAPMVGPQATTPTRELTPSARGSPMRADPMHRGECLRLLSEAAPLAPRPCPALPAGRQCPRQP